jgi:uncharacterized membrane protein
MTRLSSESGPFGERTKGMFVNVFRRVFFYDIKVKIVLSVLFFELFANIFVLRTYNKRQKTKALFFFFGLLLYLRQQSQEQRHSN